MANGQKTSAELEREVSAQRERVESRIGEIKDRLSPGQLVDELLSYSKDNGSKFASNLGQQLAANPLPAALVGVGVAWLIGSPHPQAGGAFDTRGYRDEDHFPYARLPAGGLRRVNHSADDNGQWWSEFETNEGTTYRAEADSLGNRAGHFTDEAGKKFAGFIDDAGNRVRQFQDESGNAIDDARGWANHAWEQARETVGRTVGDVTQTASHMASSASSVTGDLSRGLQAQSDQVVRQVTALFNNQPLVAGALAFAAGAALGAALPHTAQEDQLLGEQADKVRQKATDTAGDLYAQGRDKAADLYRDATTKAGEVYSDAKEGLTRAGSGPDATNA